MGKVYSKLVESFGYIAEADAAELIRQQPAMSYAANHIQGNNPTSQYGGGYDPDKVQYSYADGKPTDADTATDKPADPEKKKPAKSKIFDPNVQAIQNLFNRLGITDNAGAKINPDGIWGWRTEEAKHNFKLKYKVGSKEDNEKQAYADKIRKEYQWRIIADRDGRTARGGADMSKPKDPAIGEPTPAALKSMGISGQATQPSSGNTNLDVLDKIPNPKQGMEYWVDGQRFEYRVASAPGTPGAVNNGWYKTLAKDDKLMWNQNRALSQAGYTGSGDDTAIQQFMASKKSATNTPVASSSQTSGQATQPKKESTELDIIRKLSGM